MSITVPTGFKGYAISYTGGDPGASGITINGKPAFANYTSPQAATIGPTHLHGNWHPAPAPAKPKPAPVNNNRSNHQSPPTHAQTNSPEFIKDTYDPDLGYERYDSPGDRPYVSDYKPVQESYMNDPSTLSPEELAYRNGNIQGLDDRLHTIENQGATADALMNDYIFNIKQELKAAPETSVGTIGIRDNEKEDDDKPYSQYDTSNYYG